VLPLVVELLEITEKSLSADQEVFLNLRRQMCMLECILSLVYLYMNYHSISNLCFKQWTFRLQLQLENISGVTLILYF